MRSLAYPKITKEMRATVKRLRFLERRRQIDIAASVGISQGSVSRICAERP